MNCPSTAVVIISLVALFASLVSLTVTLHDAFGSRK